MSNDRTRPTEATDPSRVAHFRIVGRLGAGGMGVVYRAEDEKLRRTVALKLLPDAGRSEERRQRFLREARSAAAITHPNVAVVYAVDEDAGRVYIAMELVDGESLRDRLARGRLDGAEAVELATQIARGLAAAHDKGIVHRDLKPENVMITPAGVVKLLDFGLAKAAVRQLESGKTERELARTETLVTSDEGRVMGTPEYMSPEQGMGEALDVRSDVFSFGIVMYEMLAGVRPFVGASTGAVLVAIARDAPPPLREKAPQVDDQTASVVMRCLEKARDARFASAGELVAALGGSVSGRAHTLGRSEVPSRSRDDAVANRPRTLVLAALGIAIVALGAAGTALLARRAPRTDPSTGATSAVPSPSLPAGMANAGASWSHSPIPQAQALFDQGVVSYREGLRQERELWRRAVEIDPSFGGALLRIWMLDQVFNVDGDFPGGAPERESEDRNRLLPLVEDLGARDAALYRAIANADAGARSYTLGAYLEQYPDDDLAWMLVNDGTPATAKRILAARPTLPAARVLVAHGQVTPGDASEAVRTLDACLADTPQAVVCLYWRSLDLDEGGQCGRAELDAQSLLRLEPGNQWAQTLSAGLLASRGAPIDAVVEALRDPSRTGSGADTGGADEVTSYRGDFRSVSLLVREAASRVNPRAPDEVHFLQIWPALRAMTESGDLAGAGKIADDYLARRAAWPQPCPSCEAIAYAASVRAGHASRADLDAHLRADLEALNPPGPFRPQAWAMTYARATMTTSEAVAAVRKLDEVGAPDAWVFYPADVARTLALAGRFEAARPLLEESVRPCSAALRQPFDWAQAHLYLGEADEHDGTPTSACGHYAKVIGLWGHATPRSVTADEARAHAARLGCKI